MIGKIRRGMKIGELVMEHPAAVEVLYNHGFHCIGCGLAADETVEQGARAHGYSDGEIDAIILELQKAAKEGAQAAGKGKCVQPKRKELGIVPRFEEAGMGKDKKSKPG